MKKLLSLLVVLFMAIALVGCDLVSSKSITVKYETNGGSAIADTEIKLDDVATFTLPANPTKEGYEFDGWFIDETFENEFQTIDITTGTLTLYAKWKEEGNPNLPPEPKISGDGVDVTMKFSADVKESSTYEMLSEDSEKEINEASANVEAEIRVVVKDLTVETLDELEAMLTVSVSFESNDSDNNEDADTANAPMVITAQIYVKGGYVYINIPAAKVTLKVQLQQVIDKLEDFYDEKLEDGTIPEDGIEAIIEEYMGMIEEKLAEFNVSAELYAKGLELIKLLTPAVTTSTLEYKYEITEAQLNSFFDGAKKFIIDNFTEIYAIIEKISEMEYDEYSDDEPLYIEGVGTFTYGTGSYTDEDNVVHQFKDIIESTPDLFNVYEEIGVVYVYYVGEFYTIDPWKLITYDEFKALERTVDYVLYSGERMKHGENGWYDTENVFHCFSEDTEERFGYINEEDNIYYTYYTNDCFDATTWKYITPEEMEVREIAKTKEEIETTFDMIKEMVTINDCKFVYTMNEDGSPNKIELVFDVEAASENKTEYYEYSSLNEIDVNFSVTFTSFTPEITFPDFDDTYMDSTAMVLTYLDTYLAELEDISIEDLFNMQLK